MDVTASAPLAKKAVSFRDDEIIDKLGTIILACDTTIHSFHHKTLSDHVLERRVKTVVKWTDALLDGLRARSDPMLYETVEMLLEDAGYQVSTSGVSSVWKLVDVTDWKLALKALRRLRLAACRKFKYPPNPDDEAPGVVVGSVNLTAGDGGAVGSPGVNTSFDVDKFSSPPPAAAARPSTAGVGTTPGDLERSTYDELVTRAFGGAGAGTGQAVQAPGASTDAALSPYEIPKERARKAQEVTLKDGTMKWTGTNFLSFEKWLSFSIQILKTLSGPEYEMYVEYIELVTELAKDYIWEVVADFDDETRYRYKKGEIRSFAAPPLLYRFNLHFGKPNQRKHAGNPNPRVPAAGGGGGGGAGNSCSFFNRKKGCTHGADCKFPHTCSKCGGKHGAFECTRGQKK